MAAVGPLGNLIQIGERLYPKAAVLEQVGQSPGTLGSTLHPRFGVERDEDLGGLDRHLPMVTHDRESQHHTTQL